MILFKTTAVKTSNPTKTIFSDGIKKLVQRCEKCIEKKGDYVEK
jgi:hypothetical protein